jgi:hypothetical protein
MPLQSHAATPVDVEVDYGSASSRGRPPDQAWLIRLRCGNRAVIVTIGLHQAAAEHLADHIIEVLGPHTNNTTRGVTAQQPPTTILDRSDAIELVSVLEFLVGWLDADLDYTRARLPLHGTYTVEDLKADTARLLSSIKRANVAP